MLVRVRLGSGLVRVAGAPVLAVEVPDSGTVADLLRAIRSSHPVLAGVLGTAVVAAGGRVLGRDEPLPASGEVALLQPIAGGVFHPGVTAARP